MASHNSAGEVTGPAVASSTSLPLPVILSSLNQQEFLLPTVSSYVSLSRRFLRDTGWEFGTSGKSTLSPGRCRALPATFCLATEILNMLSIPVPGSEPWRLRTSTPGPRPAALGQRGFKGLCLLLPEARLCGTRFGVEGARSPSFLDQSPTPGCAPDSYCLGVHGAISETKRNSFAASDFSVGDNGVFVWG